ncbi:MAG: NUDIX hydrolase [Candidatus Aenigmarchaeota archaeon]|nr:NUDIX hydrolase [Candidatus Aenigmarchaeota archaeon]
MVNIINSVDLIIVNDKNQVLLAKRTEEEMGFKNTWSIPGGGCENNETFEEALHREIQEELGCEIKWRKYFKSFIMRFREESIVRAVYFYGKIEGDIKLNHELSEYKWFDLNDEILSLDFAFNQKDVIKDFMVFYKNRE